MDANLFALHFWKRIKKIADGEARTDELSRIYDDLKEVGETLEECGSARNLKEEEQAWRKSKVLLQKYR